jgi:hypothetical protein
MAAYNTENNLAKKSYLKKTYSKTAGTFRIKAFVPLLSCSSVEGMLRLHQIFAIVIPPRRAAVAKTAPVNIVRRAAGPETMVGGKSHAPLPLDFVFRHIKVEIRKAVRT